MFLRHVNIGSYKHFVEDSVVERSVLEAFIHLAIAEGEGVGYGASEELGSDIWLGVIIIFGVGLELTVGGEVR